MIVFYSLPQRTLQVDRSFMLSSTTEEKTSQTQNQKWTFLIYFIFFSFILTVVLYKENEEDDSLTSSWIASIANALKSQNCRFSFIQANCLLIGTHWRNGAYPTYAMEKGFIYWEGNIMILRRGQDGCKWAKPKGHVVEHALFLHLADMSCLLVLLFWGN